MSLGKHREVEGDDVPGLAELLREAAGPGAAPLTVEELRTRVAELFDLDEFRRYLWAGYSCTAAPDAGL